jgi:DoxX-like family
MSAIPVLLVLLSSAMKLLKLPAVHEGFAKAGLSEQLTVPVGLIELTCVVVYLIPRTALLGAILMTGLLGGATITTLRIGDPTYAMPVILGCWPGAACTCGTHGCGRSSHFVGRSGSESQ